MLFPSGLLVAAGRREPKFNNLGRCAAAHPPSAVVGASSISSIVWVIATAVGVHGCDFATVSGWRRSSRGPTSAVTHFGVSTPPCPSV